MTAPPTTPATTHTLEVPGALLTYDVRRNDGADEPVLFLIGSPMGAAGFGSLAGYFADRAVVTYDPRGAERSRRTGGGATSTPEEHAEDLGGWCTSRVGVLTAGGPGERESQGCDSSSPGVLDDAGSGAPPGHTR